MKKPLIVIIFLCVSNIIFSQKNNDTTTVKSEIIKLPIKATTTTDPNYEINKKKSAETLKNLSTEPKTIIKDDDYYKSNIKELKRRISEIETDPTSPNVNPAKLEPLKQELIELEYEYNQFLKSK